MIRYLVDTGIISEIHKPKPHGAVVAWFKGLRDEQICLSAATLGELQQGIERTRKQDGVKAGAIEAWVDKVEKFMIVPMDTRSLREAARVMAGKQDDLFYNTMMAVTARLNGLTVASRNEKDFAHLGVPVFNPFKIC